MFAWLRCGPMSFFRGPFSFFRRHHHHHRGWGGDPEQVHAFLHRVIGYASGRIGADDVQRGAIEAIAQTAYAELQPLQQRARELRGQLRDAMVQGADADALEALRAEGVRLADEASRTALTHLGAVRAQLSEDQWKKLATMLPFGRRRGW